MPRDFPKLFKDENIIKTIDEWITKQEVKEKQNLVGNKHNNKKNKSIVFQNIRFDNLIEYLATNKINKDDEKSLFDKDNIPNIKKLFFGEQINQKINTNGQANYLGTLVYYLITENKIKSFTGIKTKMTTWICDNFTYNNNPFDKSAIYNMLTKEKYYDAKRLKANIVDFNSFA